MLPTNLHTTEYDENPGDRSSRRHASAGHVSLFFRELGRVLATPSGDTRGHVRPYCPGLLAQRERG
jgi:hypothetical protein